MKWKEFFASTLPRSTKKSRRKSSKHTLNPDISGTTSSPETDDVIIRNQTLRSACMNTNRKKKRSLSIKNSDQLTQIAYNRQLVSPDFQYVGDTNRNNTYGHNTLYKTSSNTSESGFEDGYDHYHGQYDAGVGKWCCSAFDTENKHQPDLLPTLNHTFPRERTRIKTNPWVPSHSKTMTSSLYSDNCSAVDGVAAPVHFKDTTNNDILLPLSLNINSNNGNQRTADRRHNNDNDWFGQSEGKQNDQYQYECSNNNDGHFEHEPEDIESINPGQTGVVEGGQLVINLKTGDIYVKPRPVFSPISFQYEDDLDATLERDLETKTKNRSNKHKAADLLYMSKDRNMEWEPKPEMSEDIVMETLEQPIRCTDKDTDTYEEGTLNKTIPDLWTYESGNTKTFRKRGLRQREASPEVMKKSQLDDQTTPSSHRSMYYRNVQESQTSTSSCFVKHDVDCMFPREYTDSAYDSSTLSSLTGSSLHGHLASLDKVDVWLATDHRPTTLPGVKARSIKSKSSLMDSKRSLEDIHISLKDKVERLRAEKRIVDQKVKQAKEEEELRREEKARIQKEVSTLRKQVLLKTLQDLKDNLEDQSQRLQEAYDDILDMQWINAKLRRLRNTTL